MLPAWRAVTERHAGRTVVVVAHGIVCKVLLVSLLEGWSLADWSKMAQKNMTVRNSSPMRLSVSILRARSAALSSAVTIWYTIGSPVTVFPSASGVAGSPTTFLRIVSRA